MSSLGEGESDNQTLLQFFQFSGTTKGFQEPGKASWAEGGSQQLCGTAPMSRRAIEVGQWYSRGHRWSRRSWRGQGGGSRNGSRAGRNWDISVHVGPSREVGLGAGSVCVEKIAPGNWRGFLAGGLDDHSAPRSLTSMCPGTAAFTPGEDRRVLAAAPRPAQPSHPQHPLGGERTFTPAESQSPDCICSGNTGGRVPHGDWGNWSSPLPGSCGHSALRSPLPRRITRLSPSRQKSC